MNAKPLSLARRAASMSTTFSGRVEYHGDDPVPAMTIPVEFAIDEDELCALMGDSGSHDALFFTPPAGAVEPRWQQATIGLDKKFEGSSAMLWLGLTQLEIALGPVKLKDITLEPKVGGLTMCSLKVLSSAELSNDAVGAIWRSMGGQIEVEILDAKLAAKKSEKQANLPLGNPPATVSGIASGQPNNGAAPF